MALTKITPEIVAVNAIQGTLIADNAITAVHIATNAVSGTLIADNAVTATHIAQNVITVTQLADDAVEADKIADGVITTNHLNKAMISSQTEVTAATGDYLLIGDTSDSNNLKKVPVSGVTGLVSAPITALNNATANELVTVGSTTTELDAEANLTFDGTTLAVTGGMTTTSNIGLGTATDSWHSSYDAIQGANFSLSTEAAAGAGKAVTLAYNAYIDSGNEWTFINSDEASHIQQYNGQLTYSSAAAGTADNTITFAERMRISATGKASWSAGGVGTVATQSRDFTFYSEGASNGIDLRSNDYQIVFLGAGASSGSGMDAGYAQLCVDGTAKIALNANGNSYFNGGNVGMGTSSPAGMLDITSGSYEDDPALMLGGDIDTTGAGTRTDNTRKYSSIVGYHYSNEEEPVGIMSYDCQSDSIAKINIGVPSASYNSPTTISFYTGDTSITASPSERMRMEATGKVNIGRNPSYLAQGSGYNALSLWGGHDNWDHFCCEMRSGGNGGILSCHSNNNAAKSYTGRATDNSVTFYVEGDGDYYFSGSSQSDRDTKENIADVPSGSLALVKQLRPRTFNFKQSADGAPLPTNPKTGFIAQEVESVFGTDDGVATGTDGSGRMGVDPTGIIAHLVNAIKELETRLAALE